jgi:hypothetical protein
MNSDERTWGVTADMKLDEKARSFQVTVNGSVSFLKWTAILIVVTSVLAPLGYYATVGNIPCGWFQKDSAPMRCLR